MGTVIQTKHAGRPRVQVNVDRIAELRRDVVSWRQIARRLEIGVGTAPSGLEMRKCAGRVPKPRGNEAMNQMTLAGNPARD